MSKTQRKCKYCENHLHKMRQGDFCQKACRISFNKFKCKSADRKRKYEEIRISVQFDSDGNDVRYS